MQILRNHHHDKSLIETLEVENSAGSAFSAYASIWRISARAMGTMHWTFSKRAAQRILAPQFYHGTTRQQDETEPDQSAH
jgi:hypothetical protein